MKKTYLIADSGATKCQWTLVQNGKRQTIKTTGISPYFLSLSDIVQLVEKSFQKKVDLNNQISSFGITLLNLGSMPKIQKQECHRLEI